MQPQVIDNFLPDYIAEPLFDYVNTLTWSYGWRSNNNMGYAHWNNDIAAAGSHNGLDIADQIQDKDAVHSAWHHINSKYLKDFILIRCYANAHTYGVEGYPHTDSVREDDVTVVVYMNKTWRREWGGETVVYDGDNIVQSSVPRFNRAVLFKGNQHHSARGVTRTCPELRKTLMFKCARIATDTKRDQLQQFLTQVGAATKSHQSTTLIKHLLGTYDLLRAADQSDAVCFAGATHSLFGTNIYRDACMSHDQTDQLKEIIGSTALELVRLFSAVARPGALETTGGIYTKTLPLTGGAIVNITEEQFWALYTIEAANLYEQHGCIPKSYPNLQKFWSKIYTQ
jgi:2OG-Fe(II) oxygenase superfamily